MSGYADGAATDERRARSEGAAARRAWPHRTRRLRWMNSALAPDGLRDAMPPPGKEGCMRFAAARPRTQGNGKKVSFRAMKTT